MLNFPVVPTAAPSARCIGARFRKSGSANVVRPSPPKRVPMSLNRSRSSAICFIAPSQIAQPSGA